MRRLFAEYDAHRWAWDRVLPCLSPADVARLAVAALEGRAYAVARWLLDGDAPFARLATDDCLHAAACAGCWTAAASLLRRLLAHDAVVHDAPSRGTPLDHAIAVHRHTHYRFPVDVLEAAAARGDFLAVQWLLEATDVGSVGREGSQSDEDAQISPSSMRTPAVDPKHAAVQAAARAKQLEMVDWLVAYAPDMASVVPYDKSLGVICWSHVAAGPIAFTTMHCATIEYGYQVGEGRSTASFLDALVPLGDMVARHGDLQMLKRLERYAEAYPALPPLMSSSAMEHAAAGGYLNILQWLHERFPRKLDATVAMAAAEHGHLDVLEWVSRVSVAPAIFAGCGREAASNGHVAVLRWLKTRDLLQWDNLTYQHPMGLAIRGGHLAAVEFLHKECGMTFSHEIENDLTFCSDIPTMAYALDAWLGLPPLYSYIFEGCARHVPVETIKYLVLKRGCWSLNALTSAIARNDDSVDLCKFLYSHALVRTKRRHTRLEDEVSFSWSSVLKCLQSRCFKTAEWLAQHVPKVQLGVLARNNNGLLTTVKALADEPRAVRVLLACVRFRPSECSRLPWLPEWAVRANCFEAFQSLVDMQHPDLSALSAYQNIIRWSRDRRFMLLMLRTAVEPQAIGQVVSWAAKIGSVAVLEAAFPLLVDHKRAKSLYIAKTHALEHGYIDVLQWCAAQSNADEARRAVRQGHVAVLEWLHSRGEIPSDVAMLLNLAVEAAKCEQLACLRWLLETLDIRTDTIQSVQRELVRLRYMEAARITSRFSRGLQSSR